LSDFFHFVTSARFNGALICLRQKTDFVSPFNQIAPAG